MPLRLVLGPANSGKIALLEERFLADVDAGRDPVLLAPNRLDVDTIERDLLRRRACVLGGSVGTFGDLFEQVLGAAFPAARRHGGGIMVRVPHSSGLLEGGYTRDTVFPEGDHRNHRDLRYEQQRHDRRRESVGHGVRR